MSNMLFNLSAVTTIAAGVATACTPVLTGAGITVVAVEFLRQKCTQNHLPARKFMLIFRRNC